MVLDTRTLSSLYDLADVVRGYTTPSRGGRVLERSEENQACLLRWREGWHARHIAEAIGLAPARGTRIWVDNIMDALEGCTTRADWTSQNIFLRALNTSEGLAQNTVEGTQLHGEFRQTARQNAIIQAVLEPETRTGGTVSREAGKEKSSVELAQVADQILARQKRANHYPGVTFSKTLQREVSDLLAELGDLIEWPGKGKSKGISLMEPEERAKVDAAIIEKCTEQAKLTPDSPPYGFFARVEREVYLETECCGPDGTETMEGFFYEQIPQGYANEVCLRAGIFKPPLGIEEQVEDPENQQKVKDAIAAANGDTNAGRLATATGLSRQVVVGILAVLGYVPVTAENAALRAIILPLHDDSHLTPGQIWDQTPALQILMPGTDRRNGIIRIRGILQNSVPARIPWTAPMQKDERRIPLVASRLKSAFLAHLRYQNEEWLDRVRQNLMQPGGAYDRWEPTGYSVQELAINRGETLEFMRRVIALLGTETPQLVEIRPGIRGREMIVFPYSALQWITRGGETVEGEVGL